MTKKYFSYTTRMLKHLRCCAQPLNMFAACRI